MTLAVGKTAANASANFETELRDFAHPAQSGGRYNRAQHKTAAPEGGSHEIMVGRIGRAHQPGRLWTIDSRDSLRVGAQPLEAATRHASRRGRRRGGQFQGSHLRL